MRGDRLKGHTHTHNALNGGWMEELKLELISLKDNNRRVLGAIFFRQSERFLCDIGNRDFILFDVLKKYIHLLQAHFRDPGIVFASKLGILICLVFDCLTDLRAFLYR